MLLFPYWMLEKLLFLISTFLGIEFILNFFHKRFPWKFETDIKTRSFLSSGMDFSSGESIRTTDLRVMRNFPGFETFFPQAPHFSLA